ncbi:ATP-binding protein [Streptomyces sp. NBC_01498]|uniref:ATP-binding protein n=1 Tax=Streptomyces sp. NBC_01498 TaxID=2975870 RepID=UPI002E7AB84D|nr:ATP-binding protein [Streptomyces sp. NBC_01498]WTL28092.1 ATP-binding protein [Streptomyces sp. NBC_01498]
MNTDQQADDVHGGAPDGESGEIPPPRTLPANAAAARAQVMDLLDSRFCTLDEHTLGDVVLADVLLVTSELVTNALRHGGGITDFVVELGADELRLVVADASVRPPVTMTRAPGEFTVGGYGWALVNRLARSVAVRVTGTGKRIEAVLGLR